MEFVPIALGCGHMVDGWASFVWEAGAPYSTINCPHGCGPQRWTKDPIGDGGSPYVSPAPELDE